MVLVDTIEVSTSYRDAHPGEHFMPQPFGMHAPARVGADGGSGGRQKRSLDEGVGEEGGTQGGAQPQPRAPCKFWINTGACARGDYCRFAHDPETRGKSAAKNMWAEARRTRRRQVCVGVWVCGCVWARARARVILRIKKHALR